MAKINFETAIRKLELIVEELEKGELPLEKSLKRDEEGVKLAKICQEHLDQAELKLKKLSIERDGTVAITEMDEDELQG